MCEHLSQIGDNYGVTCCDCGEPIWGYGYGGFFGENLTGTEQCIHVWGSLDENYEVCFYCQQTRSNLNLKPIKFQEEIR